MVFLCSTFLERRSLLLFFARWPVSPAIVRDAAYLLAVRPIMRSTMLVYHSSGVADYIERLPPVMRPFVQYAFYGVRMAIQLSMNSPPDGPALSAIETRIIPNAVRDTAGAWFPRDLSLTLRILYMGVSLLLEKEYSICCLPLRALSEKGVNFKLTIVGSFISEEEEKQILELSCHLPLGSVEFTGPFDRRKQGASVPDARCVLFPIVLVYGDVPSCPSRGSELRNAHCSFEMARDT